MLMWCKNHIVSKISKIHFFTYINKKHYLEIHFKFINTICFVHLQYYIKIYICFIFHTLDIFNIF